MNEKRNSANRTGEKQVVRAKLADLQIDFSLAHAYGVEEMKDYLVSDSSLQETEADLFVEASADEIAREKELTPQFGEGYLEYICVYRQLAEQLPGFQRTVFHGAVITHGEDGFLFTAPSGTGKTTHIKLWRRYLGPAVDIVNGDKPILRIADQKVRAYGTPWAGKEKWQKNHSAPLKGICVLRQAPTNSIRRLAPQEALMYLLHQMYMPHGAEAAGQTLELLDRLIAKVPMYELACNISEEAVKVCFEAMTGKSYEENRYEN